jgi:small subunit ribosomal protein S17
MSLSKFADLISLSNKEISEEIIKTENEIFNLRFKKATRQNFKPNDIKSAKRKLAQFKTLLGMRLEEMPVKEKLGVVVSNKMQKTIVVKIENRYPHPIYSKTMLKTKKYLAHDELEECSIGDKVLVQECRPLSKRKRWKLVKIISKSSLIS